MFQIFKMSHVLIPDKRFRCCQHWLCKRSLEPQGRSYGVAGGEVVGGSLVEEEASALSQPGGRDLHLGKALALEVTDSLQFCGISVQTSIQNLAKPAGVGCRL